MHIKKLEISGFKSFGSKNIILNFQKGLIAVTGPNGSGKSNILDAIMFALGENSTKALRVDRFQSLFHDNTTNNNSNKVVKVSLTFDNTDRGIPLDNDNVTIAREMSGINSGESQYYLNSKKVSKNNIMELLEIVVASPNKLNIVQQGMITRISELNSDERRKIIEDIIGLSYFDEKKNQALKQLEESDRRLDIALAKMNEVRSRIDELEAERNEQHRYMQLELEIKRLRAIKISKNLKEIDKKITRLISEKEIDDEKIRKKNTEIQEVNLQIEKTSKEKEEFLKHTNTSNKEKIEIDRLLSSVTYQHERTRAKITETEDNITRLDNKIRSGITEQFSCEKRLKEMEAGLKTIENELREKVGRNKWLREKVEEINKEIIDKNALNSNEINKKIFLESRINKLSRIKNTIEIKNIRIEEKIKNYSDKIKNNDTLIHNTFLKENDLKNKIIDLEGICNNIEIDIERLKKEKQKLEKVSNKLDKEVEISKRIIENSERMIMKYGEKIKLAKDNLTEDYAIAMLLKDFKNLDIIGYVYNLLKWDKQYHKAVLASGNEWMKAIVVKDIKGMIMLTEFSKNKGISFLRIIPKELLHGKKIEKIPDDTSILGILSDFVYGEIENLPEFMFGNTILTKNPLTAYLLANKGYKAVSITGESFSPKLSSMQFDYGSKIADLTKDILLSDSIENLKINIEKLKILTREKDSELHSINKEKIEIENKLNIRILEFENSKKQLVEIESSKNNIQQELEKLFETNTQHSNQIDKISQILDEYKSRLMIIENSFEKIRDEIQKTENQRKIKEIEDLTLEKNKINKEIEMINEKLNDLKLNESRLKINLENMSMQHQKLIAEIKNLELEKEEKKKTREKLMDTVKDIEIELTGLREKENQAIQLASSTYTKLQEYDSKIKKLTDDEKRVTKELNQLEKESISLKKDILDFENQKANQTNELLKLGYKETLESFDAGNLYQEIYTEYENIKERINFRADETYLEIIDGYRGMSDKKNQLEEERNSIVNFIEEIGKEKEIVFMDAFKKVDVDIRNTFSEITGGSAWLDLEDQENIFSGGILLLVQFPGKPARESTALSGGEKTMAAIVFLLALQSLKPSPFYLMDEVDAHLDAQNTERLSKILLLRSNNNQIIMVTLKDSTVAKSDLIFGVYPKNGISHVVKYNHPSKVKLEDT